MNITIDMDSTALRESFRRAPTVVTQKLNAWIYTTALRTERSAKQHVPPNVDTGQLESSIHTFPGRLQAEVKPTAKYAIYVHEGRKPGRMPPWREGTPLNAWARRHSIPPFMAARAIARKGTKGNPFMDKAYEEVKPIAERGARDTLTDIVSSL